MIATNEGGGLLVKATSKATPATHDVIVHTLAQSHRIAAAGMSDRNSTAIASGSGSFVIRVGDGESLTVAVDATTTLEDLVKAINEEEGSVVASIVNDGSKATSYRMVLTSSETGGENTIAVTTNDTTLNFDTPSYEQPFAYETNSSAYTGSARSYGTYTGTGSSAYLIEVMTAGAVGAATYRVSLDGGVTWDDNSGAGYTTETTASQLGGADTHQGLSIGFSDSGTLTAGDRFELDAFNPTLKEARDAFLEIDGVAVRAPKNSISDALEGVTIDLKKADPEEIQQVKIRRSSGAVSAKVETFVSAYNDLVGGIRSQQKYDPDKKQAGNLLGDQVANRIVHDISSALSRPVAGTTGTFSTLSELGLELNETGTLRLDATKFNDAIEADTASVLEVLEGASTPSTADIEAKSVPNTAPAGSYNVSINQAPSQASLVARSAMSTPLARDEVLNFTYSSDATEATPTQKVFQVSLSSGSSLAEVIEALNDAFKAQGTDLVAADESGSLKIHTKEYGADMKFTVFSDTASAAGTTQIGSSPIESIGVDIEGSIGGQAATGLGSLLKVDFGDLKDLQLTYTGTSTGLVGTLAIVQGAASNFAAIAGALIDEEDGAIAARDEALENQIEALQQRIDERNRMLKLAEARTRKKYVALDASLGRLKTQGEAMSSQLSTMLAQSKGNN
jgi:flagellar hook-associated protein 2